MSDKPAAGDLVWINVHDETYATNWKDHPSAIGPVLPTEVVQLRIAMDALKNLAEGSRTLKPRGIRDICGVALVAIGNRVTITRREEKSRGRGSDDRKRNS